MEVQLMKKSFDKHLNIFMSYGSDCKLENNITKALINNKARKNRA